MKKFLALAVVGAMCVAGQASAKDVAAAQLAGVTGSVMVQQGGKMVAASNASALKAGDRVVSMKDGKASVTFADGCVVQLGADKMVTISAKSPCASGAGLVSATQAAPAELLGSNALEGLGYVVVGGLVVWGVIEVAKNNNDSHATSP